MSNKLGVLVSSFVLFSSSMLMVPGVTQAQTQSQAKTQTESQTQPVEELACYPATSCDDNDPEIADAVYTLSNKDLVRLAEKKGISSGSSFYDAILEVGAAQINLILGVSGTLIIAAINDGIANTAELANHALNSGKDVIIAVKENPGGYPDVEILEIYVS